MVRGLPARPGTLIVAAVIAGGALPREAALAQLEFADHRRGFASGPVLVPDPLHLGRRATGRSVTANEVGRERSELVSFLIQDRAPVTLPVHITTIDRRLGTVYRCLDAVARGDGPAARARLAADSRIWRGHRDGEGAARNAEGEGPWEAWHRELNAVRRHEDVRVEADSISLLVTEDNDLERLLGRQPRRLDDPAGERRAAALLPRASGVAHRYAQESRKECPLRLQFLGANRQVTGSRTLLEAAGVRVMIDCGLFQERAHLDRNWEMPIVEPGSVDVCLLTHAHLDHSGLLPRLVAGGFDGPVFATKPTVELAEIIMTDSARIQAEDVAYKKKRHRKGNRRSPHPLVPLYTVEDARTSAAVLEGVDYGEPVELGQGLSVTFHEAGHILGSAMLEIEARENGRPRRLVFSGDLGQWSKPLIRDPSLLDRADWVVMESTYGDRTHRESGPVDDQLAAVVSDTLERGGNVVIPTFAVERAQELIYHLGQLIRSHRIPTVPIFLDSPMAVDVTKVFRRYREYLDAATQRLFEHGTPPLRFPSLKLVRDVEGSKAINSARSPSVILATSGMCTGGRIKHHLRQNITRQESTIVFVGFQSYGTLGRQILDGKPEVRIHGRTYPVRARIGQIHGFSAHGDRDDLHRWIGHFSTPPRHIFLNHGEVDAAESLAVLLRNEFGTEVTVPDYRDEVDLSA